MKLAPGDRIIYPSHGPCVVSRIETRLVQGVRREFLFVTVAESGSVLMVPATALATSGLRPVSSAAEVDRALAVLSEPGGIATSLSWSARFREHNAKLTSGRLFAIAEVVRDLSDISRKRPLSYGEAQTLSRGRYFLEAEIATALGVTRRTAEAMLRRAVR